MSVGEVVPALALERARRLLGRRSAWIEAAAGGGYALRLGPDRRTRPAQTLDESLFRALAETPGLKARPRGGWTAMRRAAPASPVPPPGRPGFAEGMREVIEPDGRLTPHRANLARSAVLWLAGRRDADGRPWLAPAEIAAAERLGLEAEAALKGPSLTMRWDALPRSGAGGGAGRDGPDDRALVAGRRVEEALAACGPARPMIEQICIRSSALQAAEQDLGLSRRSGKVLLKQGLQALARHYRLA